MDFSSRPDICDGQRTLLAGFLRFNPFLTGTANYKCDLFSWQFQVLFMLANRGKEERYARSINFVVE